MIAAKIMKTYKQNQTIQNMTKTLTCLDMIAANIMNKYKKIQKMSTHDKNIDSFEYDSSENNEQ